MTIVPRLPTTSTAPPSSATAAAPATAPAFVRALNPLIRRLLGAGLPMGPNVLLTIRGRRTGEPRTFPVGRFEVDGRRFVMGTFGETNWVRNLRATGEATVRAGAAEEPVRATEIPSEQAAPILRRALARFLARPLLAPMLRSWYGVGPGSTDAEYLARAREDPMFELLPLDATRADSAGGSGHHTTEVRAA